MVSRFEPVSLNATPSEKSRRLTSLPHHESHHVDRAATCSHSLLGPIPAVTGRRPSYHPEGVLLESPDDPIELTRAVRVQETTQVVHDLPVIGPGRSYVRQHVETELRIPEVDVLYKEVQIESNTPQVVRRVVEVPEIVEKEIIIPTPKKIIEQIQKIDRFTPKVVVLDLEKKIVKPVRVNRPMKVVVEKSIPVFGAVNKNDLPVVVSKRFLPLKTRAEGKLELPVKRFVPKLVYVDIDLPIDDSEFLTEIRRHARLQMINEQLIPLNMNQTDLELTWDEAEVPKWSVTLGPNGTLETNLSEENVQRRKFDPAFFNSWVLRLNRHLENDTIRQLVDEQRVDDKWMHRILPLMQNMDGSISYLGVDEPLIGERIGTQTV